MVNINYKIFGKEKVSIIIEMGLGTCMGEWLHIANSISSNCGVLLYERGGINNSEPSLDKRTPLNIANELYNLLENIDHEDKFIIIAHSQGGLYAQQFTRLYPHFVKGLILLDPLSANDNKFKEKLLEEEYKRSGVDKSSNFEIMYKLSKFHLGFISKMFLKNAPPFYYYKYFDEECKNDILNAITKPEHCKTALNEYLEAHKDDNLIKLKNKGNFPDIPLVLITHNQRLSIKENMEFGKNTEEFATKIENLWQGIMKDYLTFSTKTLFIEAKHSTHYIHLTEKELLDQAINWINLQ